MPHIVNLKEEVAASIEAALARATLRDQDVPAVVSRPIPPIDVIAWLAVQACEQKIYWADREGRMELAGIGCGFEADFAAETEEIIQSFDPPGPPFFHVHSFHDSSSVDKPDPVWGGFPRQMTFLPAVMVVRQGKDFRMHGCLKVRAGDDIEKHGLWLTGELERALQPHPIHSIEPFPALIEVEHWPDYAGWSRNVGMALAAIAAGDLEKVVLARRSDYHFEEPVDPIALLVRLRLHHAPGYAILIQPRDGLAFVSVTPERLYRRRGRLVEVDALSSTVIRGETASEDAQLEKYLSHSSKERREHQHVVEGVTEALEPLCREPITVGKTEVMKLRQLQHLHAVMRGELRQDLRDSDLVNRLHPTPAVGGRPRQKAQEMISHLEPFDRGWYAAPCGWMGTAESEMAVAIRSAVMNGRIVSVFTGAGVVAGSEPEAEWREIESKDVIWPLLKPS